MPKNIIAVAISGGIDSLASLKKLNARKNVFAIHGQFLDNINDQLTEKIINSCKQIDVPLYIVDLRESFKKLVIESFAKDLHDGLTPNPCAKCNKLIKFGLLLDKAKELGANLLATGHYAKIEKDKNNNISLYSSKDTTKDQSYFLSLVPKTSLTHVLFPLANETKKEIIKYINSKNILVPQQNESQDICFLENNFADSLLPQIWSQMRLKAPNQGDIIFKDKKIGIHKGLWRHTEGQRKGLGIAHSEPLYVIKKDRINNSIYVGEKKDIYIHGVYTKEANFLALKENWPQKLFVRVRYRQKAVAASVSINDTSSLKITFNNHEFPTAPGQIATIYDEFGQVLAGAEITEIF